MPCKARGVVSADVLSGKLAVCEKIQVEASEGTVSCYAVPWSVVLYDGLMSDLAFS